KQMKSSCEPSFIRASAMGSCVVASCVMPSLRLDSIACTDSTPASLMPFRPLMASHEANGVLSCDLPSDLRTVAMVEAASGVLTFISGVPHDRALTKFISKFILFSYIAKVRQRLSATDSLSKDR